MDKPHNTLNHSTHLLDDLESIRELLGDSDLQPPLLTETVEHPVPTLDERVEDAQDTTPPQLDDAQTRRQDMLLHLDSELRAAAQSIMQEVINDFTPHIETEIKRRLAARMERLLKSQD